MLIKVATSIKEVYISDSEDDTAVHNNLTSSIDDAATANDQLFICSKINKHKFILEHGGTDFISNIIPLSNFNTEENEKATLIYVTCKDITDLTNIKPIRFDVVLQSGEGVPFGTMSELLFTNLTEYAANLIQIGNIQNPPDGSKYLLTIITGYEK